MIKKTKSTFDLNNSIDGDSKARAVRPSALRIGYNNVELPGKFFKQPDTRRKDLFHQRYVEYFIPSGTINTSVEAERIFNELEKLQSELATGPFDNLTLETCMKLEIALRTIENLFGLLLVDNKRENGRSNFQHLLMIYGETLRVNDSKLNNALSNVLEKGESSFMPCNFVKAFGISLIVLLIGIIMEQAQTLWRMCGLLFIVGGSIMIVLTIMYVSFYYCLIGCTVGFIAGLNKPSYAH